MDKECAADAEIFEYSGDDQQLQKEPGQIHITEERAVHASDELLSRRERARPGTVDADRSLHGESAEEVLTRGIDDVEEDGHQRNQHQIALLTNKRKPTHPAQWLDRFCSALRGL